MPKILKLSFLVSLVIATSLIVAYYFLEKPSLKAPQSDFHLNSGSSLPESNPTNSRFSSKPEREIQALFIKTEGSLLYFRDKVNQIDTDKTIGLENQILYVCRSPVESDAIKLDLSDPGYISFLTPRELDIELKYLEPILIVTTKNEQGQERVNYVVSAKCKGPK